MATHHYFVLALAIIGAALVHPSCAEGDLVFEEEGQTDFIFKWHGGFIGSILLDIPHDIDGWNMTLTFPKNVFNFEICPAEVVDVENKRVFHLRNHWWNAKLSEGDELEMWFNAKTWKKIRGLKATILFNGNIVNNTGGNETSESSSEDMSSEGMDNGLACRNDYNNVTCGSSVEVISKMGTLATIELSIPVDFGDVDVDYVDIYTSGNLNFITPVSNNGFQNRFQPKAGEAVGATITTTSDAKDKKKHKINIDMSSEIENAGRGHLIVRVTFGLQNSANSAITFPYIPGTSNCLCTRLNIITA